MSTKYFALLTHIGAARLANATALGSPLDITQMAVGDGGGTLPTPNPAQTKLVNEKRRAAINTLSVDSNNSNQIIAEQVIPESEGGFWIREIGLFDAEGNLLAVANCAESYKPQLQEGSGRTQTVRMILIVSSTESVTLKIDPAVVLATRSYVDNALVEHEKSRKHPDGTLSAKGFVQLSSATDSANETLAATPKAVKAANDNANGRVPSGRKVNGKALSADIMLAAGDVGAYTKEESDRALSGKLNNSQVQASFYDTTAGSVMITGAFGIGSTSIPYETAPQINDIRVSGKYHSKGGGDFGVPTDRSLYAEVTAIAANAQHQFVTDHAAGNTRRIFSRVMINGIWQTPYELWTSNMRLINTEVSAATTPFKGVGFYNASYGNWPVNFGTVFQSYYPGGGGISLMQRAVSSTTAAYQLFGRNIIVDAAGATTYGTPVEFWHSGNLVKQDAAWTAASTGAVLIAGLAGGIGKDYSTTLPASTLVADYRLNGAWYAQQYTNTDVPANGHLFNVFGHPQRIHGAQFWIGPTNSSPDLRYRTVENNTAGDWHPIATLDTTQTITGGKTFAANPTIQRPSFPSVILESTDIATGTVGRKVSFEVNQTATGVYLLYRPQNGNTGQYATFFPRGTGNVLISSVNAVTDTNGFWKTPDSAELTPSSIGALSVTELAGIPLPFPSTVAPAGWLKCNGQAFNKTLYPVLAGRYPTGYLPDLRGEFIRGADDGRGVDAGRTLLSTQGDAIRNMTGTIGQLNDRVNATETTGVFAATGWTGGNSGLAGGNVGRIVTFDASTVVPTATENRPRNVAFNYIVRAA